MNKSTSSRLAAFALAWSAWAWPGHPALAHEGEDHSHDEPAAASSVPATVQGEGPRASSQTETFELVVVLSPAHAGQDAGEAALAKATAPVLTLYLDTFETNTPVADAKVEVESGAFKAVARMQAPGVYVVSAPPLARAARHAMTVAVETAEAADLLDLALDTRAAAPGAAHEDGALDTFFRFAWKAGAGVLAFLVVLGLLKAVDRVRKSGKPS